MKVSKNFSLSEFVDPVTLSTFGDSAIWFLDPKIIVLAQFIRDYFDKPITINSHKRGLKYRGFRPPECKVGARMSQHRFGRAIDFSISGLTADEIRDVILKDERTFMDAGLTTLEDGHYAPTWVHADIRTTGLDKIKIVKP
jgi:hypothetical protein